jgi:4-hydroxy-tetrahydrodipicolinate synthase
MGIAADAVAALRLGFHGVVPSSGNLRPALWRDLFAAARAGDWSRAEALQREAVALGDVFFDGRLLGESLAALKAGLATRGLCGPDMLPPLHALPADAQAAIREKLAHR